MSGREVQGVAGCSPGQRGPTRPGVVYDGNDREVVTERPSHDDSRSSPLRLLLDLSRVRRLPDFLFRRALPAPQERRGIEHDVVVDEVRAIPAEPYRVAIRTVLVVRQQRIVAAP